MKKTLICISAAISLFVFIIDGQALALCVKAPEANLRSGPGTRYEKLWEVFRYMPLKRIARRGVWYKVKDVDGDTYWVYGPLITGKYKCAVVKDDKANIRTGPGMNYAQTSTSPAMKYYSFKVIKINDQWVMVMNEDGDKGWIYKPLLWIQ